MLELTLYKCSKAVIPNKERDEKFPHLCRTDYGAWKRWKLYPFAATLLITRIFIILIPTFIIFFILGSIAGLGLKANEKVPRFQSILFKGMAWFYCVGVKLSMGVWYTRK